MRIAAWAAGEGELMRNLNSCLKMNKIFVNLYLKYTCPLTPSQCDPSGCLWHAIMDDFT